MDLDTSAAYVRRIEQAINIAARIARDYSGRNVAIGYKEGDDPVTDADHAVNAALREILPRKDEGWLSEETADDPGRLEKEIVWVVDPIDGTREFVQGIPEWCISIGLVAGGEPVAGGVSNPATNEIFLGSLSTGVTYNGRPARVSQRSQLSRATVLASRSEIKRGEWERFADSGFSIRPMGSVAYKLALVAVGLADATWTLVPKHEWDVAAGVALVRAGGGFALEKGGGGPVFNREVPHLSGLVAGASSLKEEINALLRGL